MIDARTLRTRPGDGETVKTVSASACDSPTSLKRGVNESAGAFLQAAAVLCRYSDKILAGVPLLILIWVVARYAIDVPYLDQWDFVPLIDKMYQGHLTFRDLWMQFNEHRILFPKLIMLGLARLTHWNIRCESAVSVLLAMAVFLVLTCQIRATARVFGQRQLRWALPACSLVAFSVSQYENFLWGWQLGLMLGLLASLGAILLLANRPFGWGKFAAAIALGVVATYSFANGVLVWVTGLGLLFVIPTEAINKRMAIATWTFAAILCVGVYLWGYQKPEHHPQLTSIFNRPVIFISYVLKYIGSTCAQYGEGGVLPDRIWALVLGLAGLLVMGWVAWKVARQTGSYPDRAIYPDGAVYPDGTKARVALAPYFAMCAYSLGTALMTAMARGGFGRGQALCSRYCSMTGPLWLSIIVMLILLSQRNEALPGKRAGERGIETPEGPPMNNQTRIARWLLFGVVAFLAFSSGFAIRSAKELSGNLANGRRSVLALHSSPSLDGAHDELLVICPDSRTVIDGFRILSARGLSVYRKPE